MEFSQTQKGNLVVLYKGYEYTKSRLNTDGATTWRCRVRTNTRCRAFVKINEENVTEFSQHCHDSNIQKARANILRAKMKRDIKAIGATPRNVIGNVLSDVNMYVLKHLPKHSSLKRSLQMQRSHSDIQNPGTTDFPIPEYYADLILYDTGANDPERILAIGNSKMLSQLINDVIFGDGTFDKSPCLFDQLFTWHARVGNSFPPCIYFLLQRKNVDTYNRMFAILQQLLPTLAPHTVFLDFDKACVSAAKLAFPKTEIKGCYFHLCKNLIKKIRSVGLNEVFDTDIEMKLKLKSLATLSFVPIPDVRNVFDKLAATYPDDFKYTEVLNYFFTTYIEGVAGRPAQFPITSWNHSEAAAEGCPNTTNCFEGFHNVLKSLLQCSQPNIWNLLEGLRRNIARRDLMISKSQLSEPRLKRGKNRTFANRVAKAVQGYQNELDKLKFLNLLANLQ